MTRTRILPTVPALVLTAGLSLGLAACSGDDEGGDPTTETTASEAVEAAEPATVRKGCTAEVEVTGDVSASWTGKATVRRGDGTPTVYTAEGEDGTLMAYAGADGFEPTANLTTEAGTFTTDVGVTEGLDLDPRGTGGTVDAEILGIGDETAQLTATIECAKKGGKKKAG